MNEKRGIFFPIVEFSRNMSVVLYFFYKEDQQQLE